MPHRDETLVALVPHLAGKFIVFEGPDGSGKTTQLKWFIDSLRSAGLVVCDVREPGGTAIGEQIRQILLHTKADMNLRTEMLLYMASRAQLIEERIKPALARSEAVIADRFIQSTFAYQGAAGGLDERDIRDVGRAALHDIVPDLVLVFDVDAVTAAKRTRGVEKVGRKTVASGSAGLFDDRIEQRRTDQTHEIIRQSYLSQAAADPKRFRVINAMRESEAVGRDLLAAITSAFVPA